MKKILAFVLIATFVLVSERISFAGTAMLIFNPSPYNMDGSKTTDLAGYKIYWGTASGVYTQSVAVSNCHGCPNPIGTEIEFECVAGFSPGVTYYFAATAYDGSGNESNFSSEVMKTMSVASVPLGNIDANSSGSSLRVDGYDLIMLQKSFGSGILGSACTEANYIVWINDNESADLNGDGKVDGTDLSILSGNFGRSQ